MRIYVIAGTQQQFQSWCQDNGHDLASQDPEERPVYVNAPFILHGRSADKVEIVHTGTWRARADAAELRMAVDHIKGRS